MRPYEVVDMVSRASWQSRRDAEHFACLHTGKHLRFEHGWGRRRIARRLGVTEKWVRTYIEEAGER